MCKLDDRRGTLASTNIANAIKENKESNEYLSGEMMTVKDENKDLREQVIALIAAQNAVPAPAPSLAPTDTSSLTAATIQAQQYQAMQVQIAALQQAAKAPAAAPAPAAKKVPKKGANDLGGGQQTVRRYPLLNNYCHSCGFDVKHDSPTCPYKQPGHKDCAIITNRMGGSSRNCFHFTGVFTA